MTRVIALLALPLAATAFMTPTPRVAPRGRALKMNFGYTDDGRPAGGVQFFPESEKMWDPLNFYKDAEPKW
jgi:hypothetical protein